MVQDGRTYADCRQGADCGDLGRTHDPQAHAGAFAIRWGRLLTTRFQGCGTMSPMKRPDSERPSMIEAARHVPWIVWIWNHAERLNAVAGIGLASRDPTVGHCNARARRCDAATISNHTTSVDHREGRCFHRLRRRGEAAAYLH